MWNAKYMENGCKFMLNQIICSTYNLLCTREHQEHLSILYSPDRMYKNAMSQYQVLLVTCS